MLENEGSLEPQELADELGTDLDNVYQITDGLQKGGIIKKKAGDEIGVRSVGEYEITKFGYKVLDGMYEASIPKKTSD